MNTHEVSNQSPPFEGYNLYKIDPLLRAIVEKEDLQNYLQDIQAYGESMGQEEWIAKGFEANENRPVFHSHNAKGDRIDQVKYHPSYHDLMNHAIENKIHSRPWSDPKKGSHLVRMVMYFMHAQNEAGSGCPLTMTFSSVPVLQKNLPIGEEWLNKILNGKYDLSNRPYFEKSGLTIGMAMTEKQGGTDVRANTTEAKSVGKRGRGELYKLVGHKWFCSAPMCDGFLTLAQTERGLSCFLLPRWKPDGTKNDFRIQRLKDKLGNRSNASCEIEFDGALAWLLGEEGRGVPTIIEMVALTRYDCMIGSSALMRRALSEVLHHIQHRKVMGKLLVDQPLMKNVVADLCLESTGAIAMTYRASQCLENISQEGEQLLLRLLTPIGKYWITKMTSPFLVEAMECMGGNGYVEENIIPRLYREAPVNAIWEGSGNVQCLDVIRAIQKDSKILEVYIDELESVKMKYTVYNEFIDKLKHTLTEKIEQHDARYLISQLALAMQACQVIKLMPNLAQSFCESRLMGQDRSLFGQQKSMEADSILSQFIFSK